MENTASHTQGPALVVIDVQRGFDDAAYWGARDNPDCETNIAALIARWREHSWPLVYVRHDSDNPASPLFPGTPGNAFKDIVSGSPDLLVAKAVNSSFYGTPDLHAWLQARGISRLVICGITTNHCCETTARMAGNLGYDVYFVLDATHSFDRTSPDGHTFAAGDLAAVTAANLHGEFATVVTAADVLTWSRASNPDRHGPRSVPKGGVSRLLGDLDRELGPVSARDEKWADEALGLE